MVGVRLLPLPQHLIHLSSQFAAPKPNLPILGNYTFWSFRELRPCPCLEECCRLRRLERIGTAAGNQIVADDLSPQADFPYWRAVRSTAGGRGMGDNTEMGTIP
jgi:hypothetical protein